MTTKSATTLTYLAGIDLNDLNLSGLRKVAVNPLTPEDVLIELVDAKYKPYGFHNTVVDYLPQDVAQNPAASTNVLEHIASLVAWDHFSGETALKFIARHPNTPTELLRKLSDHKSSDIRLGLVKNPNTPVSIVERASHFGTKTVRAAAVKELARRNAS